MALTKLNNSGKTSDVALNGVGYRLFNRKKQGQATFAPRSAQGQRDETQDLEYWWVERFDDFRGGFDQRTVGNKTRVWYANNVEVKEDGSLALDSMSAKTSAADVNGMLHTFNSATTEYLYGDTGDGTNLAYTTDASAFTNVAHNLSALLDIESDGTSVYATSGTEITKGTLGSATAFTNAWSAATVKKLLYQNKNLYGLSNDSKTFGSISTSTGAWTAIWSDTNLIDMAAEPGGGGVYILGKMGGQAILWYYNGVVVSKESELPKGFNAVVIRTGWGVIFVGGRVVDQGAGVWYKAINSSAEGMLFAFTKDSYYADKDTEVRGLLPYKNRLYCSTFLDSGTNDDIYYYDMEEGGLWSISIAATIKPDITFFLNGICVATSAQWHYVRNYASAFDIETSNTNLGTSADKLLTKVIITHSPLGANESLAVKYSADDTTAYTTLTTNTTDNTTVTDVSVAAAIRFNQIKIALAATTITDLRIYSISVFGVPLVDTQKRWELTIAAPDYPERPTGTQEVIKAASIFSNLWTAYDTKTIVSFQDVDYQKTKKVYGCVVEGMEETLPYTKGDQVQEGTCTLVLREVYNE